VEPVGDDSPVLRFLREKGGGLHHACYEVAELENQLSEFRSRGAVIVKRPKPAVAFNGRRIAWIMTAEGALIELLEQSVSSVSPSGGIVHR
jgi:methylmalonyl-CoA/ethylmalonyl-CoA epimerase